MTQWEYCSIQFSEDRSQPSASQEAEPLERGLWDRLLGVYPVSGTETKGRGPYFVTYFFCRVHGLEHHTLYEGDDPSKADEETSKYVAILGIYGWEAIHVVRLENGREHWYFKRKIDPSNQYLTF